MRRRYIYSILVGLPGLVVALVASVLIFGMAAGFLWLFVFGDNPWPSFAETLLPIFFAVTFLMIWLATLVAGYYIGKAREHDPALNKLHVFASIGFTLLFMLTIVLYEWGVGNIRFR